MMGPKNRDQGSLFYEFRLAAATLSSTAATVAARRVRSTMGGSWDVFIDRSGGIRRHQLYPQHGAALIGQRERASGVKRNQAISQGMPVRSTPRAVTAEQLPKQRALMREPQCWNFELSC
jgi:hypothetical protein